MAPTRNTPTCIGAPTTATPRDYYDPTAPAAVKQTWFNRIKDMIDRYHPDLLYSDSPLPYPDEVGRQLLAHYYNDNLQRHGGRLEAVYNCKQDVRRPLGAGPRTRRHGRHQSASVADRHLRRRLVLRREAAGCHGYKSPATVIQMLCDIVSKNGNLLLNFPPRPDGTLDDDELKILDAMAAWMAVNGEAIYGTRPWKIYGEGPSKVAKGRPLQRGHGSNTPPATSASPPRVARFTPSHWVGPTTANSSSARLRPPREKSAGVTLLGHAGKLDWRQTADGLVVKLPAQKPCDLAYAFKIFAGDLNPVPVVYDTAITPAADGRIVLPAAEAEIHGTTPKYEHGNGKDHIGYWAKAEDFVSWNIKVTKPGTFAVEITYSCAAPGSAFAVELSGQTLTGKSASTGSWENYHSDNLGTMKLDKPGTFTLAVKPKPAPKWRVIGLKAVTLKPIE